MAISPTVHYASVPPTPQHRTLRGYAFDPGLSTRLETALVSEIIYRVPWEDLDSGPRGEYLEVVDFDPASGCFYAPVNLEHPHVVAQDGLAPSEGNPQFHQQMVYAVAMTTIDRFERALGRKAFWADRFVEEGVLTYVQRLRMYPHALRAANAYYSRKKASLLFGYFPATEDRTSGEFPGGMVFTCLSHDVIAHETTHALLDGFHDQFMEDTNPDVLAFHEAFADIVALFQHFSLPEVLTHQIARTRGNLGSENLLAQLAVQVGHARGSRGALRDAIGKFDKLQGKWTRVEADPLKLADTLQVHARGAILVAAVFDAFTAIYQTRTRDLFRIASEGTGVLREGELHPDLVRRIAAEATRTAGDVLDVCIRALDYCPPADLTFGDYLRALITADMDVRPRDPEHTRVAFIEAFRRRGIYPDGIRVMSQDSLRWTRPEEDMIGLGQRLARFLEAIELRQQVDTLRYCQDRKSIWDRTRQMRLYLHGRLSKQGEETERITGLELSAPFQVSSFREARRARDNGRVLNQVFVTLQQNVRFNDQDVPCGCTLVVDLDEPKVTYVIRKDRSRARLERVAQHRFERPTALSLAGTYLSAVSEPFAALHGAGA